MMEIFLSAVLGELASRSINFFISKSSKPTMLGEAYCTGVVCERCVTSSSVHPASSFLRSPMH